MKTYYAIVLLFLAPSLLRAQGFEMIFGSSSDDYGRKVLEVPNENAYLVLYDRNDNSNSGNNGLGISKIDNAGNILWDKYDDSVLNFWNVYDYVLEPDGFRITYPNYSSGPSSVVARKYNFEGEITMSWEYVIPDFQYLKMVRFMPDFSVVGIGEKPIGDESVIYKFSPSGNLIWLRAYPNEQLYAHLCTDLVVAPDGGILSITNDPDLQDILRISKFDGNGDLSWQVS